MSSVEHEPEILPPPVQPPARHRVWRSRERILLGVAGGLADALGVAPLWTRLGFVVLALFDGLGVAAYLAAWLLLPAGPSAPVPRPARRVVGLLVVPVWLAAILPDGASWGLIDGPWGAVVVLVGVAMALWAPRSPVAATAAMPVVSAAAAPSEATLQAPDEPRHPRPAPSPLGRITLGTALLVAAAGTAIAQGSSTGIKISFGLAVVVCGLGLLLGTVYGRARWLVVPAALFAGVSVAGAATEDLGVHLSGSTQNTFWGPSEDGSTSPPTRIVEGGGDTHLLLADIEAPVNGVIRLGYGSVEINAAEDVHLEVVARVGLGSIDMPSGSEEGYRRVATYASGPSDAPLVRYDVAVGFGSIEVSRYDPTRPFVERPEVILPRIPGVVGLDGQGGVFYENGAHQLADGTILLPDGSELPPGGVRRYNSPTALLPTGEVVLIDGTRVEPDGTVILPNGVRIEPVPPGTATSTTVPATTVPATTVAPSSAPATTVPATTVAPPSASAPPATAAPTTVGAQP